MPDVTALEIQLAPISSVPVPGSRSCNFYRGGSSILLRWLETQLGLQGHEPTCADRIAEYATALDALPDALFGPSLRADRWATASELLARREALRLAGWDETNRPDCPPLVRDMAQAVVGRGRLLPDEADRLDGVLGALDQGQVLPPHRCLLADPVERWPARWRAVLARLTTARAADQAPMGPTGTALAAAQGLVLTGGAAPLHMDGSLRWLRSRSLHAACDAVAHALALEPHRLADTVVCCEDSVAALSLDGALARVGLATCGAGLRIRAHPVLQVLPLVLQLCWKPVDPARLLDFVSLPVGPIPRRIGRRLAQALAGQPGLGSAAWEQVVEELCRPDADPGGEIAARLDVWLGVDRQPRNQLLTSALVQERCARVAAWAMSRAAAVDRDASEADPLVEALRAAAGQAIALKNLVATQGETVSEPQLTRLLDSAIAQGVGITPYGEQAGGARLIASLAELTAPCARFVWLGLGTEGSPGTRWTMQELAQLRALGIALDDGRHALAAVGEAERRGFSKVTEAVLAITLPADQERVPHPVWLQIKGALALVGTNDPENLEQMLGEGRLEAIAPWQVATAMARRIPSQPMRPLWPIDAALFRDRPRTSYSELASRLGCPLKWVLSYLAEIASGSIACLPADFTLKGTFCHDVLSRVLGTEGPMPTVEASLAAVAQVFDERLPLDAAPLAQAASLDQRVRLREELLGATRTLVSAIRTGGYRVVGMEAALEGSVEGRPLEGRIDCVVRRGDGAEAVIDFKYGGRNKYPRRLAEGRAVQLATYAWARGQMTDRPVTAVGYLILSDALLVTHKGSPLAGGEAVLEVEGPPVITVWNAFTSALRGAEAWLSGAEPVPARPLQNPTSWPTGADLVIDGPQDGEPREEWEPCKYCDYQILCGFVELT